ncbi:MAG: hypothetical protein Q7T25_07950 [Sideroxyarcus sp.]|nr:hypothetical protein [Sideroxyarcus sp.]
MNAYPIPPTHIHAPGGSFLIVAVSSETFFNVIIRSIVLFNRRQRAVFIQCSGYQIDQCAKPLIDNHPTSQRRWRFFICARLARLLLSLNELSPDGRQP